jgi:Fic/DOC family
VPDWDDDGPQLEANLIEAGRLAAEHARARRAFRASDLKAWHRVTMRGLSIDDASRLGVRPSDLVGRFRGPPVLADIEVQVGRHGGVPSWKVADACAGFFDATNALLRALDGRWPKRQLNDLDPDAVLAVAEAVAWMHAKLVRIHPFVNGNGRVSRLVGNSVLVRYGLPPVFRLRPRPGGTYAKAAAAAMSDDHSLMTEYVVDQIRDRRR